MDQPTQNLQEMLEKSAGHDLQSALIAKENARRRMHDESSSANVAAFDKARELVDKLSGKDAPDSGQSAESSPKRFAKISEVVKYLKDEGYKVAKSKIYNDVKAGYLTVSDDGSVSHDAVMAYVHTQMLDKIADNRGDKIDQLTISRLQKEVEKMTVQVEKLEFELSRDRGKYLPKDEVRTELALKVATFEAALKHLVRVNANEWIGICQGNLAAQEKFVGILYGHLDRLLDEMARCEELDLVVGKAA